MKNNLKENGFYFYFNECYHNYECIKIFKEEVRFIIYEQEPEEIVDKLFFIKDRYGIGTIKTNEEELWIEFNYSNDLWVWTCSNSDGNSLNFSRYYQPYQGQDNTTDVVNFTFHESKEEIVICSCKNEIKVSPFERFDVFACKICRSVYIYEVINGEFKHYMIIKGDIIPPKIRDLLKYFGIIEPVFTIDKKICASVKRGYYKLAKKYHSDLNPNLKEEEEMKELNQNFEDIEAYVKSKPQRNS